MSAVWGSWILWPRRALRKISIIALGRNAFFCKELSVRQTVDLIVNLAPSVTCWLEVRLLLELGSLIGFYSATWCECLGI